MAGYSRTPVPQMLGMVDGTRGALIGAPKGFEARLDGFPTGVSMCDHARGNLDVIVFFATRRAELERRFPVFARALVADGGLWVSWPTRTSGVATDLTGSIAREIGLSAGLVDDKFCEIDDIWSGLRFVYRHDDRPERGRPARVRAQRNGLG